MVESEATSRLFSASGRVACRMAGRPTVPVMLALAQLAWPCEQIAVLSHDAKYLLMDGTNLQTVDVGNLWWKDVWGIDVVLPGSTSDRLAFVSDRVTGGADRPTGGPASQSTLVVVRNLSDGSVMGLDVSGEFQFRIGDAWWIDGTDELLVWQRRQSAFTILDEGLNRIDAWTASNDSSEAMTACRDGGRVVVGAKGHRVIRETEANTVRVLDYPQDVQGCTMERLALGCRASVGCRRDDGYEKVIIDIASSRVLSKMRFSDLAPTGDESPPGFGHRRYMASRAFFRGRRTAPSPVRTLDARSAGFGLLSHSPGTVTSCPGYRHGSGCGEERGCSGGHRVPAFLPGYGRARRGRQRTEVALD